MESKSSHAFFIQIQLRLNKHFDQKLQTSILKSLKSHFNWVFIHHSSQYAIMSLCYIQVCTWWHDSVHQMNNNESNICKQHISASRIHTAQAKCCQSCTVIFTPQLMLHVCACLHVLLLYLGCWWWFEVSGFIYTCPCQRLCEINWAKH